MWQTTPLTASGRKFSLPGAERAIAGCFPGVISAWKSMKSSCGVTVTLTAGKLVAERESDLFLPQLHCCPARLLCGESGLIEKLDLPQPFPGVVERQGPSAGPDRSDCAVRPVQFDVVVVAGENDAAAGLPDFRREKSARRSSAKSAIGRSGFISVGPESENWVGRSARRRNRRTGTDERLFENVLSYFTCTPSCR